MVSRGTSRGSVPQTKQGTRRKQQEDWDEHYDDIDDDDTDEIPPHRFKMVDWRMTLTESFFIFIGGIMLAMLVAAVIKPNPSTQIGFWSTLIAFTALFVAVSAPVASFVVNIRGYVFDPKDDKLIYPDFGFFRLKLPLSAIYAANAETIRSRSKGMFSSYLEANGDKPRSRTVSTHQINLSGEFGSRRLKFGSKNKRDQFLALMRQYAPQARITRWS